MIVATEVDGVLLAAFEKRMKMGFSKSAIIREALLQYFKTNGEILHE